MNIYAPQTARFDGTARAMTEDEMFKLAPSIFAYEAHDSRSERFQPIPTIEVVRAMIKEGFSPVGVKQSKTRDESRQDYTKHMIRFRRLTDMAYNVGDNVFEIVLKNANDGTAAYDLMAGLFRIRCANSLVSQTASLDSIKVRHGGTLEKVQHKVIDGTFEVLKTAEDILAAPQDWSQIILDREEQAILAATAHSYRFDEGSGPAKGIDPSALLTARRVGDRGSDLWSKFNVIQENAIKGGLKGQFTDDEGVLHNVTARAINGIDKDVKLNKALWVMAQAMAELKKTA